MWSMPVAGGEERQVLASVINRSFAVSADTIYFIAPAVRNGSDARQRVPVRLHCGPPAVGATNRWCAAAAFASRAS